MSKDYPTHAVTGTARLSYVNLLVPKAIMPGDDPKYSVAILIPKTDVATKQRLDAAIEAATQQGMAELWKGQRPVGLPSPINDGDGVKPKKRTPYGEECKGHWVINASTKAKPRVVDLNLQDILVATEIYSGMYGRVGLDFYPYDTGGAGIGCSLTNVQKLADGEPLAGGPSPEEDFATPAPAVAAPLPQTQAQMQYQQAVPQYQQQPAAPQYPQQPMYPPQVPQYAPQPPYQQQTPVQAPVQYQQPAQLYAPQAPMQPQSDPISGYPVGGVYGLNQ